MSTEQAVVKVNKKQKKYLKNELECLGKQELIDRFIQLQAHNLQLKNLLDKALCAAGQDNFNNKNNSQEANRKIRKFNFSSCNKRHVLLKFFYFGWDYQGYASQEDTLQTIENEIFKALIKTCFIESRETSNYHRCGRTDKGVSAFCQVISIDVRSKISPEQQDDVDKEFNYCEIINRVLPTNIRCMSWMHLRNSLYSARFDCEQRTYRYFFPIAGLNINAMNSACKFLIGTHDFRNLCKMDVANGVTNFTRSIKAAKIEECKHQVETLDGYKMVYLEITSKAFLWHQIRCIMSILLLIGQNLEDPDIIKELLDVEKNPCKPQYSIAAPQPLNLYSCEFKEKTAESTSENSESKYKESGKDINDWIYSSTNLIQIVEDLQIKWTEHAVKTTMIKEVIMDVRNIIDDNYGHEEIKNQISGLILGAKQKRYQKLLTRKRCESLENRLGHFIKKQRLSIVENENCEAN